MRAIQKSFYRIIIGSWEDEPIILLKAKKINIIETDPDCFININIYSSKSPSQPI